MDDPKAKQDFESLLAELRKGRAESQAIIDQLKTQEREMLRALGLLRPSEQVSESPFPPELSHGQPGIFITLVHGTFARGASWTQKGSNLRRFLSRTNERGIEFSVFEWSGRNTFSARRAAAEALYSHLVSQCDTHPDADHYVIAHSHGGNIAVDALDWRLADKVKGLICLCTPFLRISYRPFGIIGLSALYALTYALIVLVPTLLAKAIGVLSLAWVIVIAASLTALFIPVSRNVIPKYMQKAHAVAERYSPSSNVGYNLIPTLVIRESSDEAGGLLGLITTINWLLGYIVRHACGVLRHVNRSMEWVRYFSGHYYLHFPRLISITLFFALGIFTIIDWVVTREVSTLILWPLKACGTLTALFIALALLPRVVVAAAMFLSGLIALPFLFVSSVLSIGFGREMLIYGLALEVTVEATPVGKWTVFQINSPHVGPAIEEHAFWPKANLRHSRVYENAATFYAISSFISSGDVATPVALRFSLENAVNIANNWLDQQRAQAGGRRHS